MGVEVRNNRVQGVLLSNGDHLECPIFINAAGPFLREVGHLLGVELPVFTELHLKAVIKDALGAVGREAPLLIWNDAQTLPWEAGEREALAGDEETRWLTGPFPSGAHSRPEGAGDTILMLWDYQTKVVEAYRPPLMDEQYPEIVLRGLAAMLPRMQEYFGRMPRPQLDGGYYTRTRENHPLVGPLPVEGAYVVVGAVSGYGIMSACGVGELLAAHVTGANVPPYASAFSLQRYVDPLYQEGRENWGDSGQL